MKNKIVIKIGQSSPVDNRPCTNKLCNFVKKEKNKKEEKVIADTWHVTCDA